MAYAKKVSRRRYRSSRARRRAWRRRYRRNNYRRRYRRTRRRRKPEYKRLEKRYTLQFTASNQVVKQVTDPNTHQVTNVMGFVVIPSPLFFFVIGCDRAGPSFPDACANISQGTGLNERVGAKIRPVSLRFFGTMSIRDKLQDFNQPVNSLNPVTNVDQVSIRMLVIQIRNGNNDYNPQRKEFSEVNPFVTTHDPNNVAHHIEVTNGIAQTYAIPSDFFARVFSVGNMHAQEFIITQGQGNPPREVTNYWDYLTMNARMTSGVYAKTPYRSGIGPYIKILKDKRYKLNPTLGSNFAFRCKSARPYRMVWKEDKDNENELQASCRNPIYIIFIPIYPLGTSENTIEINFNYQMYFTDM